MTHEAADIQLRVNGRPAEIRVDPMRRLSDVLRDDLALTGTKIGCNAGDCGACTVLVDGAQACACLVPIGQCDNADILTVEGLAGRSHGPALQTAFLQHGAAQCGICTPGMLMAAADLLERVREPSRDEIVDAIGGVLCRCTGYVRIIDAIHAAAHGPIAPTAPANGPTVGMSVPKVDGPRKMDGSEHFGADGIPADALYVRAIRSPHARARFTIGDLSAVRDLPGVAAVLTAADIPFNGHGVYPNIKDQPVLADGIARYRGEAVLAVIGERKAIGALAESAFPIDWHPKDAVQGINAARSGGVLVHPEKPGNILADGGITCGDVDAALASAALIVEAEAVTSFVEHAYIEPEAGWAIRRGDTLEVHVSTQTPYQHRDELANILQLPKEAVHLIPTACGGGFGGKLDLNVHPLMALGAWRTGRPVAYVYSRPESMASSTKRHPAHVRVTAACDTNGALVAFGSTADLETGAYASWGPTVANRVPVHAPGPYVVPHARTRGTAYYSNGPPAGAFRGFGVPQSAIASEAAMDALADRVGMDWLDFRRLNALRSGDRTITGQRLDGSVGLVSTIYAVEPYWRKWNAYADTFNRTHMGPLRRGVGIACSWYGIGNTSLSNPSRMRIGVDRTGRVTLYNGAVDIGQGSNTIMTQIAADALGVPLATVALVAGDTALTADAGKTSASRQTFVSGRACLEAARDLRRQLFALAGAPEGLADEPSARLVITGGTVSVSSANRVYRGELPKAGADSCGDVVIGLGVFDPPTTPLDANGQGNPYATYAFATQVANVEVDMELGTVRVLDIAAAHDVGRAINPRQVEGQIEGGIAQGLGMALMEEYIPGRTENLHDYLIPTSGDMPRIIPIIIEDPAADGPWGAKGVGEPALISTAPAIFGGIFKACGVRVTRVPALPHRLRAALRERHEAQP